MMKRQIKLARHAMRRRETMRKALGVALCSLLNLSSALVHSPARTSLRARSHASRSIAPRADFQDTLNLIAVPCALYLFVTLSPDSPTTDVEVGVSKSTSAKPNSVESAMDPAAMQRAAQAAFTVEPAWVAEAARPRAPIVVPGTTEPELTSAEYLTAFKATRVRSVRGPMDAAAKQRAVQESHNGKKASAATKVWPSLSGTGGPHRIAGRLPPKPPAPKVVAPVSEQRVRKRDRVKATIGKLFGKA